MLREKDEMLRELESDADELFSGGRLNNLADVALTVAGVLGSLVATILVATHFGQNMDRCCRGCGTGSNLHGATDTGSSRTVRMVLPLRSSPARLVDRTQICGIGER